MAELKAVVRKADQLPQAMIGMISLIVPDCRELLPADISSEQFRAALWLELTGRPDLAESPLEDLRACIVKAAQYGWLPGRDVHFLPFRDKRKGNRKCATPVPNYQGILRSLYRTGQVNQAFAEVVYTRDDFDLDYGRPQVLIHKPARKDRGKADGAYGYILPKGSTRPLIHYMDLDDIDRVRRKAPAHDQGPWVSDPQEMWRKTAMKNVAKYAPLTPQFQELLEEDDARLETDIPQARHDKNLHDLFDNDASASSPVVDVETEPVRDGLQDAPGGARNPRTTQGATPETQKSTTDQPGGKNAVPVETGWRRTIETHLIDTDMLKGRIPREFYEACLIAFGNQRTTDEAGEKLAAQLLEWVASEGGV